MQCQLLQLKTADRCLAQLKALRVFAVESNAQSIDPSVWHTGCRVHTSWVRTTSLYRRFTKHLGKIGCLCTYYELLWDKSDKPDK